MCVCPCHNDKKASLTVSIGDNGGIVFFCHAGCRTEDILSAIGLTFADISPEREQSSVTREKFDFQNVVAAYEYKNNTCKLRDRNKNFLWQHREPDGTWKPGRGKAPHVLYQAGTDQQTAFVCEGEKDADNVSQLGLYAVSSENGAGTGGKKWYAEYTEELTGKNCVLLPDNDDVGREFMQFVAAQITGRAKSVKVLNLLDIWQELPEKGDVSDLIEHFGAEQAKQKLLSLISVTEEYHQEQLSTISELTLEYKPNSENLKPTIDNFFQIMQADPFYQRIHFNLMTGRPEIHDGNTCRNWTDTDEAESRHLIEHQYHIHNDSKHNDALRMFFRQREYNPILNLVESFKWDGENRCEIFLSSIMSSADTPYTREVSRLIFAGGINRLYNPGCKFDDVPVLVGEQGSGKSSIVNWLALNDTFYCVTKNLSGDQRSIEALQGAWIVEIPELAAFRATDIESLKSFITTRSDKYRLPFDRNTSILPRRCIFIGTTNNSRFLTDKTGNRRFYPVDVHSNGYELFNTQSDIQDFICQCWAEARERYKDKSMPPVADPSLISAFREAQSEAMEDDWRVGMIEQYLTRLNTGDFICVKELYKRSLYPESTNEPSPKDSREIGQIMDGLKTVEKAGLQYTAQYGRQRCWKKLI